MTSFRQILRADINRHRDQQAMSAWGKVGAIRRTPGLQAVFVYRFGRLLDSRKKSIAVWPLLAVGWIVYALAAAVVRKGYGIRLSLSADIGPGFYVGHFGGVEVINCRLGQHCSVGQQTKVGRDGQIDGPRIGNGAWIGAHSKVFGPVTIGDNVTIAPGARVTKDVPSRSLVAGDPGRIVSRNYDNARILPPI
jgi:serine O-acetyltransferase